MEAKKGKNLTREDIVNAIKKFREWEPIAMFFAIPTKKLPSKTLPKLYK